MSQPTFFSKTDLVQHDTPKVSYVPTANRLPRYVCGIDPSAGAKKSGFVVFDCQSRSFPLLICLSQPDLQTRALEYDPADILFVVEDGSLNRGIWHGADTKDWDGRKAKAYGAAIGKMVQKNHDAGHSIAHFLQANGYTVERYRPCSRKWKVEFFRRQTKLPKGYNAEIRDSVRAIWHHISHLI